MSDTDKEWVELIRHMTGSTTPRYKRGQHGFRNNFCASVGSDHYQTMKAMEAEGLVVAGSCVSDCSDYQYFHATPSGCEYAGLSKAATKRACERLPRPPKRPAPTSGGV